MLFRVFIRGCLIALASLVASAGCGDDGGFPRDAMGPDAVAMGTVSLAWSLRDLSDQPIQCDQVGANTVSLQLRNRAKLSGVAASLSCKNSPSMSQLLEPGLYDVSFELHGLNITLATASDQRSITVEAGRDTPLAPITFVVDARGGLALSLAAPPLTTNCKPVGTGAGITGFTITLLHTGDGCAPVTFLRSRGAMMLGMYVVNCSSPVVTTCIENDETLTVPSMQSGSYTIHVRGKVGAADCWQNDDTLQVPPLGKTLNQRLNLALQSGISGC
jgi:hypothetical protein